MLEKLQKLLGEAKVLVEEPMASHTTSRKDHGSFSVLGSSVKFLWNF